MRKYEYWQQTMFNNRSFLLTASIRGRRRSIFIWHVFNLTEFDYLIIWIVYFYFFIFFFCKWSIYFENRWNSVKTNTKCDQSSAKNLRLIYNNMTNTQIGSYQMFFYFFSLFCFIQFCHLFLSISHFSSFFSHFCFFHLFSLFSFFLSFLFFFYIFLSNE